MNWWETLSNVFKAIIGVITSIIAAWVFLEARFDSKVQASEGSIMERVKLMRDADMEVIKAIKEDTSLLKSRLLGIKEDK